jgi:hypothetical protein
MTYLELNPRQSDTIEVLHYVNGQASSEIAARMNLPITIVNQHLKLVHDRIDSHRLVESDIQAKARRIDVSPYLPPKLDSFRPVVKISGNQKPLAASVRIYKKGHIYLATILVDHFGICASTKVFVQQDGSRFAFTFGDSRGQYTVVSYGRTFVIYNQDLAWQLTDTVGEHPLVTTTGNTKTIILERREA